MTTATTGDLLLDSYARAKDEVVRAGFAGEIDWQSGRDFSLIGEQDFLREAAWVVLNSGMMERVVRKKFPQVSAAFWDWRSSAEIASAGTQCRQAGLAVFGNRRKINALISIAERVARDGFERVRRNIESSGVGYLETFSFIGPITCFHLGKNIGLDVVKPDRHLVRIARTAGFSTPSEMCESLSELTGDRLSVVDLVLWRFATLRKDYVRCFAAAC